MSVRGSLDVISRTGVMGWAHATESRAKLIVQALLNNAVIGESVANLHRPDLAAVGMGDGNCGYKIDFYQEVDEAYLPFIKVKLEGGDVELPRSTLSGYQDFFSAVYRQYPVSGRHRSIYGGLWTDRIDASALLKDRADVGLVKSETAQILAEFLRSGFTLVHGADERQSATRGQMTTGRRSMPAVSAASGGSSRDALAIMTVVFNSKPVLDVLQVILESRPLVLSHTVIDGDRETFAQPSTICAMPSPAECAAVVVPAGEYAVKLDVVRASHLFPEFNGSGQSRWIDNSHTAGLAIAVQQHGMVDQYVIEPGQAALIGPGLIHRVHTESDAPALRALVAPSRHAPLSQLMDGSRKEIALDSGVRIWM